MLLFLFRSQWSRATATIIPWSSVVLISLYRWHNMWKRCQWQNRGPILKQSLYFTTSIPLNQVVLIAMDDTLYWRGGWKEKLNYGTSLLPYWKKEAPCKQQDALLVKSPQLWCCITVINKMNGKNASLQKMTAATSYIHCCIVHWTSLFDQVKCESVTHKPHYASIFTSIDIF